MKTFDFFKQVEPLTADELRKHQGGQDCEPSVYVTTYAKYNNGGFGQWIDLTTFTYYYDFENYCKRLHADEDDPEFMVQDFENFPECWYQEDGLPTEEEFDRIKEYAELDEDDQEAYELYLDNFNDDADLREFKERYMGKYKDGSDFAEHLCDEYGYFKDLPDWLQCCIDYSAVWRSLETGGDYSEFNGHIFAR